MTSFPPPPGFDGHESRTWDGFNSYERECTADEVAALEGAAAAEERADRREDDARRDAYFGTLREAAHREFGPSQRP